MFQQIVALAAALMLTVSPTAQAQSDYCQVEFPTVKPCPVSVSRDIMFLLDGSNSMDPNRFYGEVLDYTLQIWCSFQQDQANKAGVVLFNQRVEVIVPMAIYTRQQWQQKVLTIRESRNTTNPACCSCCTPTGDAFRVANAEFDRAGVASQNQIAFVITDGLPSNNNANTGGFPEYWWYNPTQGFNPSLYNTQSVPDAAWVLKNAGRRIILVGVPNALGVPPDSTYFNGLFGNNKNYCLKREQVEFCTKYYTQVQPGQTQPNFPLPSVPMDKNSFTTKNWGQSGFIDELIDAICIVTTSTPTKQPTKEPTSLQPTKVPTNRPTLAPTSPQPTKEPTKQPTSQAPTKQPTQQPTLSPTKLSLEQIDLTFLVDRSNSMTYVPELCNDVLATFPSDPNRPKSASPCWQLWTEYIQDQVDDFVKIKAGLNNNRAMGWADSYGAASTPAKGLRVNIIGFACTNKQRTPKIFEYSLDFNGGVITNQADFNRVLDTMRTSVNPFGGTCPHLAVEQAIKYLETTSVSQYPLQSVILMTDGVTYDGAATPKATKGLFAYKALTFAVGISVAKGNTNFGMTKEEIATQRKQLSAFVRDDPKYFYDLENGWSGLLGITSTIADSLPEYFFASGPPAPIPRYTWCGFRRQHNCATDSYRQGHCKWKGAASGEYQCAKK